MWHSQQLLKVRLCLPCAGEEDWTAATGHVAPVGGGAGRVEPEPPFPQKSPWIWTVSKAASGPSVGAEVLFLQEERSPNPPWVLRRKTVLVFIRREEAGFYLGLIPWAEIPFPPQRGRGRQFFQEEDGPLGHGDPGIRSQGALG